MDLEAPAEVLAPRCAARLSSERTPDEGPPVNHAKILALLVGLLFAVDAGAQKLMPLGWVPPDKLERETKKDDAGFLQWKKFETAPCPTCKRSKKHECPHCARAERTKSCLECKRDVSKDPEGKGAAPCRICNATGKTIDILEQSPCPGCMGAGVQVCMVCGNEGSFPIKGGSKKPAKCGCCKGKGGYPCTVCKGKRFVTPFKLKPSVAEAKLKDLRAALKGVEKAHSNLAGFASKGEGRKDAKAFAKILKPAEKYLPSLKGTTKFYVAVSKAHTKGSMWVGYGDMQNNMTESFRQSIQYFLERQKRVLELCIARQEHNEQVAGAGK